MPTVTELDEFAKHHIRFEVRHLVGQVKALEALQRNPRNPAEQAYLEAALLHVRLLDEFLGGRGAKNRHRTRSSGFVTGTTGSRLTWASSRARAWRRCSSSSEP